MDSSKASSTNMNQVRVLLWATSRTLSTVFEKCISNIPRTQVIHEPFCSAYFFGPDREPIPKKIEEGMASARQRLMKEIEAADFGLQQATPASMCSYQFWKNELEADYPTKDLVFCKDMAYVIADKYDMIPQGYRHTFIIRHPQRAFPSKKNQLKPAMHGIFGLSDFRLCDTPSWLFPKKAGFQELYELMMYLKERGEPEPIVIDADDLQANSESVVRQYCQLLGIPFEKDYLEWTPGNDCLKAWKGCREILLQSFTKSGGYHDRSLGSSTTFEPPKVLPKREELPEDILECVDVSMPYYQKMYDLRIKP